MNTPDANVRVRLVAKESQCDDLTRDIVEQGGTIAGAPHPFDPPPDELDDYADAQFEPLLVISATVSAAFLLKTISGIWLDHSKAGGTVVDARGDAIQTSVVPNVPRNTLVVITPDKATRYSPNEKNDALEAIKLLIGKKLE